jgi:predicted metal-binding protein
MKYNLTKKEVTVAADEFVSRYRDVERIRQYCLACPSYGNSWACPPFDFDLTSVTDGFKTVTLMASIIEFDEATRAACLRAKAKSRQVASTAMAEVWKTLLPHLLEMERETPGSRCFTFRCSLCPEGCTRPEGKPCRHPDKMRHSLESVGFDIVAMARDLLGIDLEWSKDGTLPKHLTIITALMLP